MTVATDQAGNAVPLVASDENELVNIDRVHSEIHRGNTFDFHVENLDADTNENTDTLILTGSKEMHVTFDLEVSGGRVEAFIYETPTTTDNGTEITPRNRNRESSKTSAAKIYTGPTVTAVGTELIKRQVFASSQGSAKITSAIRPTAERILAPNKAYLLRQTSKADNVLIALDGIYYEE